MKSKNLQTILTMLAFAAGLYQTAAQGTGFIYQGRLAESGNAFTGNAEFQPTLWNAASGGSQVAANTPANLIVSVTNGLFVVPLDFGANFPGENRWLQLEVRTSIGPFTTLSPRQQLTATPYAMTASNLTGTLAASQLSGALPAANLSGTYTGTVTFNNTANSFSGNGAGLTTLNASRLSSGTVPDARLAASIARTDQVWLLEGNKDTIAGRHFLGTTDNEPLELWVNNARALRIEPNTNGVPNIIGGSWANFVGPGVVGAIIVGGGTTQFLAGSNLVLASYGVVSGGSGNMIAADSGSAIIGGGVFNQIDTNSGHAKIGAGFRNKIGHNSSFTVIAGGSESGISSYSDHSVIGGGAINDIGTNSPYGTVAGGQDNDIGHDSAYAAIAGGRFNDIGTNSPGGVIGGGTNNNITANSEYATIAGGREHDIGTNSDHSVIGGGRNNNIGSDTSHSVIAGGLENDIGTNSSQSAIGGGWGNDIAGDSRSATIAGGFANDIDTSSSYSTIGGGNGNNIAVTGDYATIPGGLDNHATAFAFAAGYNARATNQGAFVWSDGGGTTTGSTNNNSVTFRARGGYRFFTGTGSGGAQLPAGATSWSAMSDRNAKKNIRALDCQSVLEKLSQVPVTQWHYLWESESEPQHLGPMAQDFKAAFYPGRDDKTISTLEFDGVALAAIQGLNQKLEEQRAQLKVRDAEIEQLKQGLAELKEAVSRLGVSEAGAR